MGLGITPRLAKMCYDAATKMEIKLSLYTGNHFKIWNIDSQRIERDLTHYILFTFISFSSSKFLLWHVGVAVTHLQYHESKNFES